MKRSYSKYSIKRSGANRTDVTRGVTAFKGFSFSSLAIAGLTAEPWGSRHRRAGVSANSELAPSGTSDRLELATVGERNHGFVKKSDVPPKVL